MSERWKEAREGRDRAMEAKQRAEKQRQAENEYLRICEDGIKTKEELLWYVEYVRDFYARMETQARLSNNQMLYCECVGIQREMINLYDKLVLGDAQILAESLVMKENDGTADIDVA